MFLISGTASHARDLLMVSRIESAVKNKMLTTGTADNRPANGTVHLNAVDASGLTAAVTLTHGESFGAQVTVDGL